MKDFLILLLVLVLAGGAAAAYIRWRRRLCEIADVIHNEHNILVENVISRVQRSNDWNALEKRLYKNVSITKSKEIVRKIAGNEMYYFEKYAADEIPQDLMESYLDDYQKLYDFWLLADEFMMTLKDVVQRELCSGGLNSNWGNICHIFDMLRIPVLEDPFDWHVVFRSVAPDVKEEYVILLTPEFVQKYLNSIVF